MKKPLLIVALVSMVLSTSCASYSTSRRPEAENIINAPIDTVWEKTLEILPQERMTLQDVNKEDYFIAAKKHMTFWSFGDNVSIRLIPKGEARTIMHLDAGTKFGWADFGHEGRMCRDIFERIRTACESSAP